MARLRVTLQMSCDSHLSLVPCLSTSWQAGHKACAEEGMGGQESGAEQKTGEGKKDGKEKRADNDRGG